MTQLDPRAPTGAPPPPDGGPGGSPRRETGFNWRISAGMFVGLAILFGVLFGLRVLHIFPPEPGQDAEIAAARATQAALGTQEALAPRPTVAVGSAPAAATSAVQVNPTEVQAAPTPVQASLPADLAAAIVQGYSNYWTVRVNALRDPDPANPDLESVMVGTELSRAQQLLSGYQQQGMAYESDVKHQIWITQA